MGRAPVRRMPTQAVFEPLVTAPQVSVSSRVVYILRRLIAGGAARMSQLFARSQSRSTNVATFWLWLCWNWCAADVSPSAPRES